MVIEATQRGTARPTRSGRKDILAPPLARLKSRLRAFLTGLSKMDEPAPQLLEHLASEDEYTQAREHIVSVGKGLGLSFE